jgi:DNA processing protein
MNDSELICRIGISLIPGVGCITAKKLIAYTGSAEAVFREKKKNLIKIPDIGSQTARCITNQEVLSQAEKELKFIRKYKICPVFYLDPEYPDRLKQCPDSPVILYVKGNASLNQKRMISVVGTRKATHYGKDLCSRLIRDLASIQEPPVIVSGLAYGIDITAHLRALEEQICTMAVFGTGLDRVYPSVHKSAAIEILEYGALITEFVSGTLPDKQNFVKRNRIVAGMTEATIVIESGLTGGALITAGLANSYNRDVFAFPGRTSDPFSRGCHYLIRSNQAALIENAEDLIYQLGWQQKKDKRAPVQTTLFSQLTSEEQKILEVIRAESEISVDLISIKTGLPMSKVSVSLLNLEFSGMIRCSPGQVYIAV